MKNKPLHFFSPSDNDLPAPEKVAKAEPLKGSISSAGKLVFPLKTIEGLGLRPSEARFKIGTPQGKRKLKSLYLIPTTDDNENTFELSKVGRTYGIPLSGILQKQGVDYTTNKLGFSVKPFDYEEGTTGYELRLEEVSDEPRVPKPRGRRPKNQAAS
ncbi:hypothetical protein DYU11_21630 [Fibrisoma montanum]|uniref:Uncharacterized protein n=1 Tax=Fibrisoma montanum TaxID=2305895 RepID=A0A418M4I5_9BACT|nr:hypothetical protein [Fibrisoma montanum]RIV20640.1 hypothetical protein DYU11_21630 [Fibrisoma montanum]